MEGTPKADHVRGCDMGNRRVGAMDAGPSEVGHPRKRARGASGAIGYLLRSLRTADEAGKQGRGVGRLRRRTAYWLAWSLGIICGALLVFTLLLFALNRSHPGVNFWGPWVQETVAAVTVPAIGLLILSRRPQHPIGWLFCWAGLAGALDHFFGEYAIYALQARPDSLPGGEASAWIVSWMWVPFNALLVYVALLYPDGRPPSKRWRPVAWLVGITAVAAAAAEALLPIAV